MTQVPLLRKGTAINNCVCYSPLFAARQDKWPQRAVRTKNVTRAANAWVVERKSEYEQLIGERVLR
jgi:hypothetical protein